MKLAYNISTSGVLENILMKKGNCLFMYGIYVCWQQEPVTIEGNTQQSARRTNTAQEFSKVFRYSESFIKGHVNEYTSSKVLKIIDGTRKDTSSVSQGGYPHPDKTKVKLGYISFTCGFAQFCPALPSGKNHQWPTLVYIYLGRGKFSSIPDIEYEVTA